VSAPKPSRWQPDTAGMWECDRHGGFCAYHAGDPNRCDRCHRSWSVILRAETRDDHEHWHDELDKRNEASRDRKRRIRAGQGTPNPARKGTAKALAAVPGTPGTPQGLNAPQSADDADPETCEYCGHEITPDDGTDWCSRRAQTWHAECHAERGCRCR
jgi:hypothetical protein